MTSIYFPSHMFILFKRLVNVVSTLSISKNCISGTSHLYPDHSSDVHTSEMQNILGDYHEESTTPGNIDCPQNWPWLAIRQTWERALLGSICGVQEIGNTLYLQNPGRGKLICSSFSFIIC